MNNVLFHEEAHIHQELICRCMLDSVPPGKQATIKRHHAKGAVRQRLLDLGFIPGKLVTVVRRAPLGDPVQCRVAGYNVTLRKTEAALIEIEED